MCVSIACMYVQLISEIDTASDRVAALAACKLKDARLATFLDDMLVCVGVCTRREDGTLQFNGNA